MSTITDNDIQKLEAAKKARLAEIEKEYNDQIEAAKNLGKWKTKFAALVQESGYSGCTEFLTAIGVLTGKTKSTKAAKTTRTPSTSDTIRGPLSKDDKAKIVSLKSAGKSVEEIAKEIKRTVAAVEKVLKS